jgi:hypothetical protein
MAKSGTTERRIENGARSFGFAAHTSRGRRATQKRSPMPRWARMLTLLDRDMRSSRWSLFAVATIAMPSAAWGQARPATATAFSDSLSCLVHQASPDTRDSLGRDSAGARPSGAPVAAAPAIILRASASAREVRFAAQPRIRVRLCGAVLDSVRILERRNLPDPVQPGVTYRDVFVAVEILGHLNAQCLADKITGGAGQRGSACASIQARDTSGARRGTPP